MKPRRRTTWQLHPGSVALYVALTAAGLAQAQDQAMPLPPPEAAVQVLSQLPAVRAAQAQISLAQARSAKWQAGPYEWVAKAAANRHRDDVGARFTETEIGLETGLRWPAKIRTDHELADSENTIGALSYADAWHEAARSLLADWFDSLREVHAAAMLDEQAQLTTQQLSITERRVQAGEAAPLELLAAQAEEARIQASATQARAKAEVRLRALRRQYPGLPEPASSTTPSPPADCDSPAQIPAWAAEILDDNHELELAQARTVQAQLQAQRTQLDERADATWGVRASRESHRQAQQLGAYVSLPLGGAGRRADTAAALAQAQVAEHTLAQARQRIETDAWRTASAVVENCTTWQQLQRASERTQRSATLQGRAYALGESPLADWLLARRSALEAKLAAHTAALDSQQSRARLLLDSHQLWLPPNHTNSH